MSSVEPIITRSAHWGWTEHRYFGHQVFGELLGKESFIGLTALSVLGRRLPPEALAVLEDAAVALTLADPRIWPLKLTRTLASYGTSVPAVAAGLLVQAGARIGPWTVQKSAELLHAWRASIHDGQQGADVETLVAEHLVAHRFIWGFGTPFREQDERLVAFSSRLQQTGRTALPYWQLFEAIATVVTRVKGAQPNVGMALAAVLLDIGVKPEQSGALATALVSHMFFAHAVEESEQSSPQLRLLPSEKLSFEGASPRVSERSRAQQRTGGIPAA